MLRMQPDTCFRTRWRAAMKLCETTPNMSFGPKVVDWACSLRKTKKWFQWQKLMFLCMRYPFSECVACGNEIARNHPNMSIGPKVVDWACSLRKTKKWFWWQKLMLCMHHETHFWNGWRATTKLRETTPNMTFGPKVVDWACSLRKTKKWFRWQKVMLCMQPDTRFRTRWRAATKFCETTPNMSSGPKVVDWVCSLQKTKKWFRWQKLMFLCTWYPFSEWVTCRNEIARTHPKHEFWT
jgi:hypothetical protein